MSNVESIAQFRDGDVVICPAHSLGTIVAIETRSYGQNDITCYKIFFEKSKMYFLVPIKKVKEIGIRKPCSKETINKMYAVLARASKIGRGMWNRRVQEYETKIYSGSILLTAEVVRDLFTGSEDANRSYSERVIYENALYRISAEAATVLKVDIKTVEEKIVAVLVGAQGKSKPEKDVIDQKDDFDDDLEIYDDIDEKNEIAA